jgi:hypothetical protein
MKRIFLTGFAIWLVATIALRLAGQRVFATDTMPAKLILLGVSAPLMFLLPRRLFKLFSIPPAGRALGGILLVAPGMFLDTFSAMWFSSVFPNLPPDSAGAFGGWLLFCNVVALVSAVGSRE